MSTRFAGAKPVSLAALAAVLLLPVSASARDRDSDVEDVAAELRDPQKQEAMGHAMAAMMEAMLAMKVEPLARAMEKVGDRRTARRIPRDATLGDLAGPEARDMPEEVREKLPAMMGAMAEMAGMMAQLRPVLERMGEDFEREIDKAGDGA